MRRRIRFAADLGASGPVRPQPQRIVVAFLLAGALVQASAETPPDVEIRRAIEQNLLAAKDPVVQVVQDPASRITRLVAPLLARTELYRVEKANPSGPTVFYWGWNRARKQGARLTGQPQRWSELVLLDGVTVRSAADAIALARLFDVTTHDTGERHLLVESVEQIPYRPKLSDEAARVRDESRQTLRSKVQPLKADSDGSGGFRVSGCAIDGMLLVEVRFQVARDGTVKVQPTTPLRSDLPLVYTVD